MIDWKLIKLEQEELGINKDISLEEFKKEWIKELGFPKTKEDEKFLEKGGRIEDFYEDYMTSELPLKIYLQKIVERDML